MKNSHDLLVPISEDDILYIFEDHFEEQCHNATYNILCKNCGCKCQMASNPKLFVNSKGTIIIDGFCDNCQKPLRSTISTSHRIDWNEYAMVVRDARVCFVSLRLGNHKTDALKDVPTSSKPIKYRFKKDDNKEFSTKTVELK